MKELNKPSVSYQDTFFACTGSIVSSVEKDNTESHFAQLEVLAYSYQNNPFPSCLNAYVPLSNVSDEYVVLGNLTKGYLKRLYSYHMVERKFGSDKYDEILALANERCPYCGGIGFATTLDHYLPKSKFPQFSVFPLNLVPSCKDCNTGKNNSINMEQEKLTLHPYFDYEIFSATWIEANIDTIAPLTISFSTNFPEDWSPLKVARATNHFKDYRISRIYSIMAADEIALIKSFRSSYMRNLSQFDFRSHLEAMSLQQRFPNDWRSILYKALANSDEITGGFDWL